MNHDQIIDKYKKRLLTIAQKSILYSASKIPERTRKFSGQSRASTNMSIGRIDRGWTEVANYGKDAISGTLSAAKEVYALTSSKVKLGDMIFITNNVPYIRHVEYKHGDLMFEQTIGEWKSDVGRAVSDSR